MIGIYKIINRFNNKCYIGQSNSIKRRLRQHMKHIKGNHHDYLEMSKDYNTGHRFESEILIKCELDELNKWEKHYLDSMKSTPELCYNKNLDNCNFIRKPKLKVTKTKEQKIQLSYEKQIKKEKKYEELVAKGIKKSRFQILKERWFEVHPQ